MNVAVWAPRAERVAVRIGYSGPLDDATGWTAALEPQGNGWYGAEIEEARPGRDYAFVLDDEATLLPDPRSRWQPYGVHGPSRFYDDSYQWKDLEWRGKALPNSVFYELHVGTFTPAGTFEGAIEKLDALVELGISHVELLPVNDFDGEWNWGYDGVLWYAVHEAYGGPDGLKRFVDACHGRGLAVALDVVYNHLGPSGNILPRFGPYLKEGRNTWGELINLDGESSGPVRAYIVENALMWLSEFHVDALRLDAVHALRDQSATHLLTELSARVDGLSEHLERPLVLIAESDLNDAAMVTVRGRGGHGLAAQWDDDVHHALHALLTGERQAYYVDFGSLAVLAKVMTQAFLHNGTHSTFRGRRHGKPVDRHAIRGDQFVVCLQNHDQVGNRAAGDRLPETMSPQLLKVGALLLLTSPFTPMLWMGEEWAASTRWPFFTAHADADLAQATAEGRVEEFRDHGWDTSEMIDPQDPAAFAAAILRWEERNEEGHREMLTFYRDLLALRRRSDDLTDPWLARVEVSFDEGDRWLTVTRGTFLIVANFAQHEQIVPSPCREIVLATVKGCEVTDGGVRLPAESAAVAR